MKLGIALGGGGAKGFAHLGVLQVLKEAGIDCQIVTGTSIGALVGGVYVGGDLDALTKTASKITLKDIPLLMSPALSKSGLFSGKNALELLNETISISKIEDLEKAYAAVSVDLRTGTPEVFTDGDLKSAIRASISIPGIFTPVVDGEKLLVDGGLLEPVPVELCRKLGADVVIAVDLFGSDQRALEPAELSDEKNVLWPSGLADALSYIHSISNKMKIPSWGNSQKDSKRVRENMLDVIEGTLVISQRTLTELRLKEHPADIVIQPGLREVGFLDFHRGEPVIEIGRVAALKSLPAIRELLKKHS